MGDLPKDLKFTYTYCVEKDGKHEWERVYFHKGTKVKPKVWRKQELQMFEVEQRGTMLLVTSKMCFGLSDCTLYLHTDTQRDLPVSYTHLTLPTSSYV